MDHNISRIADGSTELFSELPILCWVQPEEQNMEQNVIMIIHSNTLIVHCRGYHKRSESTQKLFRLVHTSQ